jgi:hypothetical protein
MSLDALYLSKHSFEFIDPLPWNLIPFFSNTFCNPPSSPNSPCIAKKTKSYNVISFNANLYDMYLWYLFDRNSEEDIKLTSLALFINPTVILNTLVSILERITFVERIDTSYSLDGPPQRIRIFFIYK